ncbi:hypothetical protein DPMN_033705 [Dreissena polymorpha]|uniref:Uncharacterized protein n=1 Tax=Dreissena polymorpha TaxID=45954 RepID=A0A9D4M6J0_DREPO|nr:hypothetical protein DPMN_033705 [Dreissena polymorpha]
MEETEAAINARFKGAFTSGPSIGIEDDFDFVESFAIQETMPDIKRWLRKARARHLPTQDLLEAASINLFDGKLTKRQLKSLYDCVRTLLNHFPQTLVCIETDKLGERLLSTPAAGVLTNDGLSECFGRALNIDLASARLKRASVLYCTGNMLPSSRLLEEEKTFSLIKTQFHFDNVLKKNMTFKCVNTRDKLHKDSSREARYRMDVSSNNQREQGFER